MTDTTTTSTAHLSRTWPYVALTLGGGVSVACNVQHAYVVSSNPAVGAVALSVVWPVLVLVAVELVARSSWPVGWTWTSVRVGGLGLVAIVAAVVSYRHMAGLLAHYGEDGVVVALGPVAIDGLMVMATAALLAAARADADRALTPATVESSAPTVEVVGSTLATVEASIWRGGAVTDPAMTTPSVEMTTPSNDMDIPAVGEVASTGRPSTPTTATGPSMTSTLDERVCAVRGLVAAGDLPPAPSAEAIRRAVGGSTAIARRVRDVVADDIVQVPGQLAALDAELAALAGMAGHELARLEVVR